MSKVKVEEQLDPSVGHAAAGLNVHAVTFRYPQFELTPTSFSAATAEVVAIIGPNGSGKSTLLGVVSGGFKPVSGRVWLDGEDVHRLAPLERARLVGLARQESPLLFGLEVREFVRQGRHPHLAGRLFESADDEKWVDWALAATHLNSFAGRRVTEISGGEFQRAVLARALAQRPRLLLLDEPTAHLDIGYQIEMLGLLCRLAASEGFIAVIVTHELNLAAEFADRLLLLDAGPPPEGFGPQGGRLLRQGTAEEVLDADLLSRVFRTPVLVDRNPSSGRPRVTWKATRAVAGQPDAPSA